MYIYIYTNIFAICLLYLLKDFRYIVCYIFWQWAHRGAPQGRWRKGVQIKAAPCCSPDPASTQKNPPLSLSALAVQPKKGQQTKQDD